MALHVPPAVVTEIAAEVGRDPSTVRRAIVAIDTGNPARTSSTTMRIVERSLARRGYAPVSRPAAAPGDPHAAQARHEPRSAEEPGRS